MKLEGSVAVVIGGAKGMGKSYCESLLKSGAKVMLCDIQETAGRETEQELSTNFDIDRVAFMKCDGASENDIRAVLEETRRRWERLDVIVNHVGILHENQWQRMVQINVGSSVISTKLAEEFMGKNNGGEGGVLVHTSSRSGIIPSHLLPIYSATKAAMVQYTRAMMHPSHYKRHGIRMMCICPGMTKTDFVKEAFSRDKVALYEEIQAGLKYKDEKDTWVYPEWVGDLLITVLEKDDEYKGAAAEINSRTPVFHYKGEWDHLSKPGATK